MLPFCHLQIKALRRPCPDNWITTQIANPAPQTLGEHLRNHRLALRLLQKQVAAQFGVPIATYQYWERNTGVPSVQQIPTIIRFLGFDPKPEPADLPRRIAYGRRRLGWTQDDLAKRVQVDDSVVAAWETGRTTPPENKLRDFQRFLGESLTLI